MTKVQDAALLPTNMGKLAFIFNAFSYSEPCFQIKMKSLLKLKD